MHPGNDPQRRIEHCPADGYRLVGVVVSRERNHRHAFAMRHAGVDEHVRQTPVSSEKKRRVLKFLDLDARSPLRPQFDNHHALPHSIKHAGQHDAALPIADDQDKRLLQRRHAQGEAPASHRIAQRLILRKVKDAAERIGPGHHAQVDADDRPGALRIGERMRQFAEADRRRRIADEIERVEKTDTDDIAVFVDAGDQHQPPYRHRIGNDQDDQRPPQPPQDDEKNLVHASPSRFSGSGAVSR